MSRSKRINSIAAPVVPTKLAIIAPRASITVLTIGEALRSPEMRTPPVIVKSAKSNTIKEMYSPKIALIKIVPALAIGPASGIISL